MQITRILNLPINKSFFLLGPRGSGKTTLINTLFNSKNTYFINLLNPALELKFGSHPEELIAISKNLPSNISHIVVDEIQKTPKLLDVVHLLIEEKRFKFILTGSSARKLKKEGVNLLAGRAFQYNLLPFSYSEIKQHYTLQNCLEWGFLPGLLEQNSDEERDKFLESYTNTYLKEEIWHDHLVKNVYPFNKFLEVAAQHNGKILNYAKIARDIGVDEKTIKVYFQILVDTWLGFFLDFYDSSVRKSVGKKPKFYFYDNGIVRSLTKKTSREINESTSDYGECFEHLFILECYKLSTYYNLKYEFYFYKTRNNIEIDLIIVRPNKTKLLIEIKSAKDLLEQDITKYQALSADFSEEHEAICIYRGVEIKTYARITVYPWELALQKFFAKPK